MFIPLPFYNPMDALPGIELNSLIERPAHSETVQYYCARVDESLRDSLIDYYNKDEIRKTML